jgi:hypothetical protein
VGKPDAVDPFDVTDTVLASLEVRLAEADAKAIAELAAPALDVDARTPAGNLASRDNIVPAGPGSVEDYL